MIFSNPIICSNLVNKLVNLHTDAIEFIDYKVNYFPRTKINHLAKFEGETC